ncbi:MAG TPA: lipid biosynthesis B12-binding/radical SAM protein [Deltaproteobacteria bacterium]|mgnify:CR=1 FL=1|nr:lipid biosynthesis B12-binding/radical SAM protein [Deltaproteobacteria bacterium]HQB37725.1 lipid biosynthesis B12-binding/radical SAM protein [Deltaproteobacteria bacterium]
MRLLLISANQERDPYPVFPIGLAYITPGLKAAGHELAAIDLCFSHNPNEDIAKELDRFKPDAVLISLRNLDNVTWPASHSYAAVVRDVVAVCRGRAITIIGGSGFSLMPAEVLAYAGADYGVAGEGEEILPRLLECLQAGKSPSGLPGVVFRDEHNFIHPHQVGQITTPDRMLFDSARYNREGGMANVQTKRGCPFNCIYCTYPLLEGRQMRLRPVSDIIAEIRQMVELEGVEYIYFVDDIFNYPVEFAATLCRAMIEEQLPVRWTAFINPAHLPDYLLELMLKAGCDALEFGTESGSDLMLENLGKSFRRSDILQTSALCSRFGVDFAHYILFGGPGESRDTMLESFELMDQVAPTAVIGMTGIRIYPGTALEQIARSEGVITADDSLLEPVFYISPIIRDTLCELVTTEAVKRRTWVVPSLEINTSPAMMDALRIFKVSGPLWKLMKRLGRTHIKPLDN